jgi:hypothetical protein
LWSCRSSLCLLVCGWVLGENPHGIAPVSMWRKHRVNFV